VVNVSSMHLILSGLILFSVVSAIVLSLGFSQSPFMMMLLFVRFFPSPKQTSNILYVSRILTSPLVRSSLFGLIGVMW